MPSWRTALPGSTEQPWIEPPQLFGYQQDEEPGSLIVGNTRLPSSKRPLADFFLAFSLLIAALLVLTSCGNGDESPELVHYSGRTMGTYYSVKIAPNSGTYEADVVREDFAGAIEDILEEVNASMSTYRPDSELSRFNSSTSTDWFAISPELYTVVDRALMVSQLTDGAFDITVGPVVNLWGFGPAQKSNGAEDGGRLVDEEALILALANVGYRKLTLRASPPAIRKSEPGVYMDLSAIAKGFAVDLVAEYLESRGINNYLVDIGGELRGGGTKAPDKPWLVAVEKPTPGERTIHRIITLTDLAVATSGDYRNFFEENNRRYSHTIDPKTGRPVEHNLVSVTVIHKSAMYADALATAISVLGPAAGYRFAVQQKLPVWLITRTATGFNNQHTPQFPILEKSSSG